MINIYVNDIVDYILLSSLFVALTLILVDKINCRLRKSEIFSTTMLTLLINPIGLGYFVAKLWKSLKKD